MICFICNNYSAIADCDVCYSYISVSGNLSIYNINGNPRIYINVNNNEVYLTNDEDHTRKFLFKNEDFFNLSNEERYEYLKSIANNLEFL